jgi:opacity protein-like surface antigen
MKKYLFFALSLASFVPFAFSGSDVTQTKTVVPSPPALFGLGWYGGIDGGINVYQNYRTDNSYALGGTGDFLDVTRDHKISGFGGIKLGYVFGSGTFRPTIEEDIYYNGISSELSGRVNGAQVLHSNFTANTGAFMTNFIGRFSLGNGRFQPYLGAGVGAYYGATNDLTANVNGVNTVIGKGRSGGNFAWQAIAGSDYYLTPKLSVFGEYKYLNYNHLGGEFTGVHNVGQSLIGAGLRVHF